MFTGIICICWIGLSGMGVGLPPIKRNPLIARGSMMLFRDARV